jgi:hypothetical protein
MDKGVRPHCPGLALGSPVPGPPGPPGATERPSASGQSVIARRHFLAPRMSLAPRSFSLSRARTGQGQRTPDVLALPSLT